MLAHREDDTQQGASGVADNEGLDVYGEKEPEPYIGFRQRYVLAEEFSTRYVDLPY